MAQLVELVVGVMEEFVADCEKRLEEGLRAESAGYLGGILGGSLLFLLFGLLRILGRVSLEHPGTEHIGKAHNSLQQRKGQIKLQHGPTFPLVRPLILANGQALTNLPLEFMHLNGGLHIADHNGQNFDHLRNDILLELF